MPLSPKYEFRVVSASISPQAMETELNRLGAMGWYLTATTPGLLVLSRLPQTREQE